MKLWIAVLVMWTVGILPAAGQGQSPAPPTNVIAVDHDWDNGTRADLTWTLSPADSSLQGYVIRKKAASDAAFSSVDIVPPGTNRFTVSDLTPGKPYLFQVAAVAKDLTESSLAVTSAAVTPTVQWFDGTRVWFLIILVVFCGSVIASWVTILVYQRIPSALRLIFTRSHRAAAE